MSFTSESVITLVNTLGVRGSRPWGVLGALLPCLWCLRILRSFPGDLHQEDGQQLISSCHFLPLFTSYHILYYHIWATIMYQLLQVHTSFFSQPFLTKR